MATAVADGEVEVGDVEGQVAAVEGKPKRKSDHRMQMITLPNTDIKNLIDAKAKEQDISTSRFILNILSQVLDFEIPTYVRTRTPKYASEAEREQARKDSADKRKARVNTALELLARLEKGEDPAVIAAELASA